MAINRERSEVPAPLAPWCGLVGDALRPYFPIFSNQTQRFSYLDTAASSQKPQDVIDRISNYLAYEHANVRRGAYSLSSQASQNMDEARSKIAHFIGAASAKEVIFTRGTTESINLLAHALEEWFTPGDVVLLTVLEHHSNIVPWQMLAKRRGLTLQFVDCDQHAQLDMADLEAKLERYRPKLLGITHVANSFGSVTALDQVLDLAHAVGALVFVDAAQSVAHKRLQVAQRGIDFLAFSGHKLYGPTGIGALFVRTEHYPKMQPFMGGGDMIAQVALAESSWAEPPQKFEAGTPSIAEAIAFGTAIDFVEQVGIETIAKHESALFAEALDRLRSENGVTVYGPALIDGAQESIIAFNLAGVHPHDLASIADSRNVQFRAGHHCAMPALHRLGLPATVRVSFGMYSDRGDIEALLAAIAEGRKIFG